MTKRGNALSLSDRYELNDVEPDVDPAKVADFLGGNPKPAPATTRKSTSPSEPARPAGHPPAIKPTENRTPTAVSPKNAAKSDPWTSRTIRLRQRTANALTKAALGQKTKQLEGTLAGDKPVSVQEIAELGIRLALKELGYIK